MFLERQTECGEQGLALLVGFGCGDESDLHPVDAGVLVDVDLGEDDLLLDAKGVVATAVHVLGYTVEVADTGEGDTDELLEELIHLDVAKSDLATNGHALTELEVGDVLARDGDDSLLAGDEGKFLGGILDKFLVLGGIAYAFVDGDLDEAGSFHRGIVGELLDELVDNLLLIGFLQSRNVTLGGLLLICCCFLCHNYLISCPDFLATRTFLPSTVL